MKSLLPIAIVASLANLITVILYLYAGSQPGGSGLTLSFTVLWMPAVWLMSITISLVYTLINRKVLFQKGQLKWTLPSLILCTPIPIWVIAAILLYSPTYGAESDYIARNGYILWHEEIVYSGKGGLALDKYYRLKSADQDVSDNSQLTRDSVWTYFNSNGDTSKVERYDNGKLISTTIKAKK